LLYHDQRFLCGIEPADELEDVFFRYGDAARRGGVLVLPDVQENGAAQAGDNGVRVVFDDDAVLVPVIGKHHVLEGAGSGFFAFLEAIVIGGVRIVDPDVLGRHRAIGHGGTDGGGVAEDEAEGIYAHGCPAIAFTFTAGPGKAVPARHGRHGAEEKGPRATVPFKCIEGGIVGQWSAISDEDEVRSTGPLSD